MQDLINEIRKQIEYVGQGGTITKETIDLLAIKQFESVIFDLTDTLGRKKISEALSILRNLIFNKEPIQKIFITLYNHFKKLYITNVAIKEKLNIAESLKLKPNQTFLVNKYTMQAKYFKENELKEILQEFIQLNRKSFFIEGYHLIMTVLRRTPTIKSLLAKSCFCLYHFGRKIRFFSSKFAIS